MIVMIISVETALDCRVTLLIVSADGASVFLLKKKYLYSLIHIYVYLYICIYICIYIHTCTYMCTYLSIKKYIYTYIHTNMDMHAKSKTHLLALEK